MVSLERMPLLIFIIFCPFPFPGKLFSTRSTANTQKTKPTAGNSLKDFCGLMGWTNPALLHDSNDKEMAIEPPPQDFLQLNMEKEAKQEFNTHSLELQHSLKPVSVRQKKKLNKVRNNNGRVVDDKLGIQ